MNATKRTPVWPPTAEYLSKAARLLERDELVAMPTETVYGLAGNAFSANALAKIFEAKERPTFDPLIVHVPPPTNVPPDLDWLAALEVIDLGRVHREYGQEATIQINRLIAKFWPGPLTFVLPKNAKIPDLATAGLDTVGVRMPSHPVAVSLLQECGFALAAPSANRFGRISPTRAADVIEELDGRIATVLDGGSCEVGLESTIVGFDATKKTFVIFRPGKVTPEALAEIIGRSVEMRTRSTSAPGSPSGLMAPGMTESHYAPQKPVTLYLPSQDLPPHEQLSATGVLTFNTSNAKRWLDRGAAAALPLSAKGEIIEIAQNLFRLMRELDANPQINHIIIEALPHDLAQSGLGFAITDRTTRAAAQKK